MIVSRILLAGILVLSAGSAQAALKICNNTDFVQGVSIGYQGDSDWTSEGWWNVQPTECANVVAGDLKQRYYYYRAEIDGGDFTGQNYFFCTSPQEYTIVGDADCLARGYDREDFREIDVGEGVKDFTLTLVADTAGVAPVATAGSGLKICNQTAFVQGVSIGYEGDQGWTSEGWWNIDPKACATVISGDLTKQYYYYRAEIDGGPFDAGTFNFCTSPQEYTIVGDSDCEARGYVTEAFAEINVGQGVTAFVFTLVSDLPETVPDTAPAVTEAPEITAATDGGLRICNETALVQGLSIGYQDADDKWTSEGWWNLQPQGCATVIAGELQKRYYYYRAEVDGGPFKGGGYNFCTSPEEYTIVGDTDCEARGYVTEDFAEIDTGPTAKSFVFTIAATGAAKDEPELFEEAAPEAVDKPDAVVTPEPVPEMSPEPEPEAAPAPEAVPDPMAEPDAPPTPRRGGSRGG